MKVTKGKVQVGFKAKIEIICETEAELLTHLSVIRATLKKELLHFNGTIPYGVDIYFDDSNCYGYHYVDIKPDIQ